jgi:predicted aldo/keto reductase-like oxidoreductase
VCSFIGKLTFLKGKNSESIKMSFEQKRILGKTGLEVGRLGISSSYRAPQQAYEEAFEKGCNYFTWGTFIKGRSTEMEKAIREIIKKGQREKLVLAFYSYAHQKNLTEFFLNRGLKTLGIEYIDVLLLGYFPKRPPQKIIDGALELKEKGKVRFLGLSGHNRKLFPQLAKKGIFDVFHIRYNAAHRGAETESFPYLQGEDRPGIVSFTATRWGKLLKAKKMPEGERPLSAVDCYRFVLSHPAVDVVMVGTKTVEEMREDLNTLESDIMSEEELARMHRIGDYIYKS